MKLQPIVVRNTRPKDFPGIAELCESVYPQSPPWQEQQLSSHLRVFEEGQFVAVEEGSQRVVGMSASLIVLWDDYEIHDNWREFTDHGMFTNHDPANGRTLYGAEVMVHPGCQRHGVGKKIYRARTALVKRLGLLRIRAGARLRGFHKHSDRMSAEEYVSKVVAGKLKGPTLSFQLREGFHVIDVVHGYLRNDPESEGWAAVIEWLNPEIAQPQDYAARDAWLGRHKELR
jgi:ribosomal protein S18 acetylase RimI-like enzyme